MTSGFEKYDNMLIF